MKVQLLSQLKQKLDRLDQNPRLSCVGRVLSSQDGVARAEGLLEVATGELVTMGQAKGVVLNLGQGEVGIVLLNNWHSVSKGQTVKPLGSVLQVPVGPELAGRVIDPLGEPLDGQGPVKTKSGMPLETEAPGVIDRQPVSRPVQTGISAIDAMIPIGRGQRELIIGDRGTGKTSLTIDTIINQKNQNMFCVYVAIGQKRAKVARLVTRLKQAGAMEYTIVVAATASDSAALNYVAPYAGCSVAEFFRDQGFDALVIYDDLSKHAVAYREMSLVLRRPPGREAYPGDVFYLHSRLLERAAQLSDDKGGGSLTALPIIETQAGDVSAYIPTNVISITDGQIYLESDLFYSGIRPAVNVGLSVSRVGSAAQTKAMKTVAKKLRLELAQFRELQAFAQFGSDLDKQTRVKIERGQRLTEVLKQTNYAPRSLAVEVISIFIASQGLLDDVNNDEIQAFVEKFYNFLQQSSSTLIARIEKSRDFTEDDQKKVTQLVKTYREQYSSH